MRVYMELQAHLNRKLKTLATDVYCINQTHTENSVIQPMSPSNTSLKFSIRLSGDPEAVASDVSQWKETSWAAWMNFSTQSARDSEFHAK